MVCKKGYKQTFSLNSVDSCTDLFDLKLQENQLILNHKSAWKNYNENEFCLQIFEKDIIGKVCIETESAKKYL